MKPAHKLKIGSSSVISATIIVEEEYYTSHINNGIPLTPIAGESCKSNLISEICECLPWEQNYQIETDFCTGDKSLNCSKSVEHVWDSVGGNCEAAVKVSKKRYRMDIDQSTVCTGCSEDNSEIKVNYKASNVYSSECQDNQTLTIILDHTNDQTYIR